MIVVLSQGILYLQDHLGNNRVVAKSDGTVIQTNHYYPFGMSFTESTHGDKQPYKYNNKELDMNNGLNWYDYDARQMEAVSGRLQVLIRWQRSIIAGRLIVIVWEIR